MEKYLEKLNIKEIKEYNIEEASLNAICFYGSLFKNPGVKNKILLTPILFLKKNIFYEFNINDIIKIEEIEKITDSSGNLLTIVKLWIKKGAKAIKHEPFIVE